jgi:mRNA-degrading endonuclease YafQ of YafQ-DinJ toxin-antitoxin module
MKKFRFTKEFDKEFAKLLPKKKAAVKETLVLYSQNPIHRKLRHHKLHGEYAGQSSISAGGDLRIHLIEDNDPDIIVVTLGTHSQLYK